MTDAQFDIPLYQPGSAADASPPSGDAKGRRGRVWSGRMVSDAVILFDVLTVLAAGFATSQMYLVSFGRVPVADAGQYVLGETLAAILFVALCRQQHAYRLDRLINLPWQLCAAARNAALSFAALAGICILMNLSANFSRGWALAWVAATGANLALGRVAVAALVRKTVRAGYLRRRRALIAEASALAPLLDALRDGGEEPAELVRVFSFSQVGAGNPSRDEAEELVAALRGIPLDEIIVACPENHSDRLKPLIDRLRVLPADIRVILLSIAHQLPVRGTSMLGSLPVIDVAVTPLKHWHLVLKATFDWGIALVLAIAFSPLLAIIALLIKLDSRGPVFFIQERFGFNNNVIRVIKFRTMYVERGDASGAAHTVRGDARITRIGRRLRAHSLDELPQFFNVLRGEMSLVGPRPHALTMKAGEQLYHEVVSDYFARHRVKPGMTGWAQVNGLRGEITSLGAARERVEHDLQYIDNWSLWLDLKILLRSAKEMLGTENAF